MDYSIVTYPCEEGGYVVEIPDLKGCLAQGETLEEALNELEIVRDIWLETAEKYGQQLPEISSVRAEYQVGKDI